MTKRTGILSKSPLKYVLASVRFAPWPLVAKKMDEIQDELRDVLPLMHHIKMEAPEGQQQGAGQTHEAWMLADADKDYCVQFSKDQIIFFTTTYSSYQDFAAKNSRALKVLYKYMNFIDVHNAGVRYLDHIKPKIGETKSQYISERYLSPTAEDLSAVGGHVMSIYKFGAHNLRVNVLALPGAFPIPQEMVSIPLILNGPEKQFEVSPLGAEEFIVDMDAVAMYENPKRVKQEELEQVLNDLHNLANKFFRQADIFTEHAFNVWKGES
ncbi:TIGR04255 family protein [Pseudomonas juntendi]|uniref:TIGR04255 family protein n=1 Tax=Pseudomonas juntendi TaxID=2666183 RepID=UPI001379D30C|nr:TIGR04255 family protein [Pseudomonas juntendi]